MDREELLRRYAAGERDFSGMDLSNISPPVSQLSEYVAASYGLNSCNFRGANFSSVDFSDTFIMNCDFRDTICFRADFTGSVFTGTNFTGADLREAKLEALEGIGVIFENVDFRGCGRISNFVTEGTLYIRNCIGQNGEIINRFGQDIDISQFAPKRSVVRKIDEGYVDEWNGIPISELLGENLKKPRILGDDVIPF